MRAVTVLVVFCPCAFILATPTAVLAGIGNAAKYGVIVRSGDALERLSKTKIIAFDKTGTLTYGKPQVTSAVSVSGQFSDEEILQMAALAEQKSEHPLGKAIWSAYEKSGGENKNVKDFRVIAGQGVSAVIDNRTVLIGKEDFMTSRNIDVSVCRKACEAELNKGATIVYAAIDGAPAGFIALRDAVREDAKETVEKLKAAGITPMLLTGDNEQAAAAAAEAVGIQDVRANLLPEEKMNIIKDFADGADPICMVGDGVNAALLLRLKDN